MYKVLFLARPDLYRIKAGDTIQIKSLMSVLTRMGIKVNISLDLRPDLCNYDLVHCFNILRVKSLLIQLKNLIKSGIPILITPIYWNMSEYLLTYKPDKLDLWREMQALRNEVLSYADLILPNAHLEWDLLKKDFNLNKPYKIVYNGVNSVYYQAREGFRNGVISVGRIHSRKNQLALIKAMKGSNIPVLLIGDNNEPDYYKKCSTVAGEDSNIKLHRGVDEEKLIHFYKNSKVHVLPSWYDTPGLVNLEAGLAGCNIVTTERGTAREYLKNYVYYCNPADVRSIKEMVLKAYYDPLNYDLKEHILANFTWEKIGNELIKIYSDFLL